VKNALVRMELLRRPSCRSQSDYPLGPMGVAECVSVRAAWKIAQFRNTQDTHTYKLGHIC